MQHKSLTNKATLYLFCLTEVWERFGAYTLRAMLILYMLKVLDFSKFEAYNIFATYSALSYLAPVLGGYAADKLMGRQNAIILGGVLLIGGYSMLALPQLSFLYWGLGLVVIGSGFFIPNIANMVGMLYQNNNQRDAAFSLFYTAINLGGFFPPLIAAGVIAAFGWQAVFLLAAFATLLSLLAFAFALQRFPHAHVDIPRGRVLRIFHYTLLVVGAYAVAHVSAELIQHSQYATYLLVSLSAVFLLYSGLCSWRYDASQRRALWLCLSLIIFSIVFGILYQQASMSLVVFTEYNVNRQIFGWTVPTIVFQALNPLYVICLGPLFAKLWLSLGERNPSLVSKFAFGTLLMGASFVLLAWVLKLHAYAGLMALVWILISYALQAGGELCVSPIGLSMITQLSPKNMIGLMMGCWYLATAVADIFAGVVAKWTVLPSGANNALQTNPLFAEVFQTIGLFSVGLGALILLTTVLMRASAKGRVFA